MFGRTLDSWISQDIFFKGCDNSGFFKMQKKLVGQKGYTLSSLSMRIVVRCDKRVQTNQSFYVCMANTIYLFSFVETPRKFIIAELSIRKLGSSSVLLALMKIRAYGSKALQ